MDHEEIFSIVSTFLEDKPLIKYEHQHLLCITYQNKIQIKCVFVNVFLRYLNYTCNCFLNIIYIIILFHSSFLKDNPAVFHKTLKVIHVTKF